MHTACQTFLAVVGRDKSPCSAYQRRNARWGNSEIGQLGADSWTRLKSGSASSVAVCIGRQTLWSPRRCRKNARQEIGVPRRAVTTGWWCLHDFPVMLNTATSRRFRSPNSFVGGQAGSQRGGRTVQGISPGGSQVVAPRRLGRGSVLPHRPRGWPQLWGDFGAIVIGGMESPKSRVLCRKRKWYFRHHRAVLRFAQGSGHGRAENGTAGAKIIGQKRGHATERLIKPSGERSLRSAYLFKRDNRRKSHGWPEIAYLLWHFPAR